jgi:hypothetical protein
VQILVCYGDVDGGNQILVERRGGTETHSSLQNSGRLDDKVIRRDQQAFCLE